MQGHEHEQDDTYEIEKRLSTTTESSSTTQKWTDSLKITEKISSPNTTADNTQKWIEFSVVSWNILAEAYITPRSHKNLPESYADVSFTPKKRRELLCNTLSKLSSEFDIICLQELDSALEEVVIQCLSDDNNPKQFGYVYAPRGGETVLSDDVVNKNGASTSSGTNTQSAKNSSANSSNRRADGCAIFYWKKKWKCVDYEVVEFDDLTNDERPPISELLSKPPKPSTTHSFKHEGLSSVTSTKKPQTRNRKEKRQSLHSLSGITSSYKRRNAGLFVRLEAISPSDKKKEIIVGNAHLYWHPGYEYVKLSQAHYFLHRLNSFVTSSRVRNDDNLSKENINFKKVPALVCGDMNSKPNSIVHQYFTNGYVDARTVAPWHYFYDEENEKVERVSIGAEKQEQNCYKEEEDPIVIDIDCKSDCGVDEHVSKESKSEELSSYMNTMNIVTGEKQINARIDAPPNRHPSIADEDVCDNDGGVTTPRYLLDMTLNKFTRWLRILGIDAALETEEEERARTGEGRMILFERCRRERRILLTTSYKLLLRKDCPPGAYLINPQIPSELMGTLVHLLLLHGVTLEGSSILTRCVVCNGMIKPVENADEKCAIFEKYGSADFGQTMDVYKCDGCGQGYWWSEDPGSSASRVKLAATELLVLCIRGGVPINGSLAFFDFIDVEKEQRIGKEQRESVAVNGGIEEVIGWLKDDHLEHPFLFRSAYTDLDEQGKAKGELLPFTNVTSDFVGTLDYIFYDNSILENVGTLNTPTTFNQLNSNGIVNGHLLPSSVWPSDHLAVGSRFRMPLQFDDDSDAKVQIP